MGEHDIVDKKFTVYAHVAPSGQAYVGITSQPLKARWGLNGGGYRHQHFYEAIKQIGWDNFEHLIIAENLSMKEAAIREKELIEKYDSYKNGFNCSLGGETISPFHHTREMKEKISKSRKGLCCGSDNPMYGRPLRDRFMTNEDYEKWKTNIENARKMRKTLSPFKYICVNTGETFKTATDAAKKYGIKAPHSIISACKKDKYCSEFYDEKGRYLHFDYYEKEKDYTLDDYILRRSKRPIICFPSKILYCTAQEVERCIGIPHDTVRDICERKVYPKGYDFMYYSEYLNNGYITKKNPFRSVVCIDTGEVFSHLSEASRYTGCDSYQIGRCCKGETNGVSSKNGKTYLWQYYDEYLKFPKDISMKRVHLAKRKVICTTTKEIFESAAEADRYYGLARGAVNNCCRGVWNYCIQKDTGLKLEWTYHD